jgi:hypothetical protein
LSTDNQDWSGNQTLQNNFSSMLSANGLKGDRNLYDIRSGGARTYISQLEMLGMIYRDNNKLFYTIAGEDIISGIAPLPITQYMLLNIQYPSPYSMGKNVSINPHLIVKPFLFLFHIIRAGNLQYITQQEMQILMVYGHNNDCDRICIEKIKMMRDSSTNNFIEILNNPDEDLYTPRTNESTIEQRLVNLKDDTNCFKNWLESNMLIVKNEETSEIKFYENPDYSELIETHLKNLDAFLSTSENSISFQRSFGSYNRKKDTRSPQANEISKRSPQKSIICSHFYEYCGLHIVSKNIDLFCEMMQKNYGFTRQQVLEAISPIIARSLDYFATTYFEFSHGGMGSAISFEKATTEIFQEYFGISARHIGQIKRPDNSIGGYADILLDAKTFFGLIDTKASASYSLTHDDYLKMLHTYIPNFRELIPDRNDIPLSFVCYVAGGDSRKV